MADLFARVAPDSDATRPATRAEAVAYVARWGLPAAVEVLEAVHERARIANQIVVLADILDTADIMSDPDKLLNLLRQSLADARAALEK